MTDAIRPLAAPAAPGIPPARDRQLRAVAQQFEASFLAEMLKSAGFGRAREGFGGGGAGEEAFSGMLAGAEAEAMAKRGGIGIAGHVYRSLLRAEAGRGQGDV